MKSDFYLAAVARAEAAEKRVKELEAALEKQIAFNDMLIAKMGTFIATLRSVVEGTPSTE